MIGGENETRSEEEGERKNGTKTIEGVKKAFGQRAEQTHREMGQMREMSTRIYR